MNKALDIMMTLFEDEQILKAYAKGIEDNKEKETERKITERMIEKGEVTLEEIADYVPTVSFDELKEIESKVMQMA